MKSIANKVRRGVTTLIVLAAALLCLTAAGLAGSGTEIAVKWSSIDGGGIIQSTAGAVVLSGTMAQAEAGVMTGGSIQVVGGFWAATVPVLPGDFDGDGDVDLDDHQQFFDCLAGPNSPPNPATPGVTPQDCLNKFDFDMNTKVDLKDWSDFIKVFLE